MWENIVEGELARTAELPVASRVAMMGNKVRALGKIYAAGGGGGSGSSSSRYVRSKAPFLRSLDYWKISYHVKV